MGTELQSSISPEEYLATAYEGPDREYVYGTVVERGMPNYGHGRIQSQFSSRFWPLRDSHRLFPCVETRMRLAPNLYRIPDVAVFAREEPQSEVPDQPPLVMIEILSRDDRMVDVMEKLAEYERWGVQHIWLIDPLHHQLLVYQQGSLTLVERLALPETPFSLSTAELFPPSF